MITVSEAWKQAHKERLLPETFIEITYSVTEPGLQTAATSAGTMEECFSEAEKLVSILPKDSEKHSSLEWNFWGLDGSFEYFDGTPADPGYVTAEQAGEAAAFAALSTITVSFSEVHTELIPGITITWSEAFDEWATKFRVTAYNGTTQVAQKTVEDNTGVMSVVWLSMENYDSIVVEVLEWCLPHRRARAIDVYLGIKSTYTKDDLLGFTHSQSVDLLSAALPKNEITFKLRNEDARWNPDNPAGAKQYLLERQEIRVRYGMDVNGTKEWIDGGTFWLSGWNTPANGLEASFTARDALEFMGEAYAGTKSGTIYSLAMAALEQAGLPTMDDGTVRYVVDDSLKNYSATFDGECTVAEMLQMVAHDRLENILNGRIQEEERKADAFAISCVGKNTFMRTMDYLINMRKQRGDKSASLAIKEFELRKKAAQRL